MNLILQGYGTGQLIVTQGYQGSAAELDVPIYELQGRQSVYDLNGYQSIHYVTGKQSINDIEGVL